jgi:hypothetical protein
MKSRRLKRIITVVSLTAVLVLPSWLQAQTQITVISTTGTSPLAYSELRLAFSAINAGTHGGDISIQITESTTESATAVLNASGSGSALYSSVTIYPTVAGLLISGTINGGQIINLNGADKVTIDGRVNATGSGWSAVSLTISNTSTVATNNTATIRLSNAATQNVVKYCNLLGSSLISVDNDGGIVEFNQSGGNSNNTIYHNTFTNAGGNRPYKAIFSRGGDRPRIQATPSVTTIFTI